MTKQPIPSVRRNIIANFVGKFAVVAIGVVFPPVYARYLGMEAYGLIGVYSSLCAVLGILDLGLSATFNREMARLSTDPGEDSHRAMRDMVATFGAVYWGVGVLAGGGIFLLAPLVARWVDAHGLPASVVTDSLRLMGLVFAFQWPTGAYNGGLLGLQRHAAASAIQVVGTAARFVGAALVIWKVSRTVHAFFLWQAIASSFQTILTWWVLRRSLPSASAPGAVRWTVLVRNWRFSLGMSVISLLSIALTQTDKIVVSGLLTLEKFGYYTLAWTVGTALSSMVAPIFVAVFPRLSQLAKQGRPEEMSALYHSSSQLVSVVLLPAAIVLVLFSREVLLAWSGDLVMTEATCRIVIAVAIGSALNGLMNVPYALQLAHGWTTLVIWTNVIAVSIIVPLVYVLAKWYGPVGAACSWAILNAGYSLFMIRAMHHRLLQHEMWRWYLVDVGLPLLGALLPALVMRLLLPTPSGRLASLGCAVGTGLVSLLGSVLAAPALRRRGMAIVAAGRARISRAAM